MKDAIVHKLHRILETDIDSECKVVYVLCEVRKLLERHPPDPIPFALKLHCHWALHVDLTHKGTTLPFLKRVDEFAANVLNRSDADPTLEYRMGREFLYLETFRDELQQFFRDYDLPTDLCNDEKRWNQFVEQYAGVIEDGSLSCPATGLNLVREVVFKKGRDRAGMMRAFDVEWDIVLLDGRTLTVTVNALEELPAQTFHYHLH